MHTALPPIGIVIGWQKPGPHGSVAYAEIHTRSDCGTWVRPARPQVFDTSDTSVRLCQSCQGWGFVSASDDEIRKATDAYERRCVDAGADRADARRWNHVRRTGMFERREELIQARPGWATELLDEMADERKMVALRIAELTQSLANLATARSAFTDPTVAEVNARTLAQVSADMSAAVQRMARLSA